MRKVRAEIYRNSKWIQVEGLFHQWGNDFEEYESGPANYSVGIIELPDGHIVTAVPEKIQFVN